MLGIVIGESSPTVVKAQTEKSLPVGEYVIINSNEGEILGFVESSIASSAALNEINNYDEAVESLEISKLSSRDKSYTTRIRTLGLIQSLKKGKTTLPALPPEPGNQITRAGTKELKDIFEPIENSRIKIGKLLRNSTVNVTVNGDKILSRHLGILAMTGMGKSNLVALITKRIAENDGTVVIFDYHKEYSDLKIPKINIIQSKINPRRLDAEQLSEILEIRKDADVQRSLLIEAFNEDVRKSSEFWESLIAAIRNLVSKNDDRKQERHSAQRVVEKIKFAQDRMTDFLDTQVEDPISLLKEGVANVVDISSLSENQANVILSYYLEELLKDVKKRNRARASEKYKTYRFNAPLFLIIEEAHVFIPKGEDTKTKYWASKIAREGRKFGLGLCIVSQRPRSIDSNILGQMGSLAIMRIVQQDDQSQIASAAESVSKEFVSQLTSLNVGDAFLIGQWTNLPTLVHIDEITEKIVGRDASAWSEWEKNKKMKNIGKESNRKLIKKDLLLK
ncbi:MAG: ATP-binding protein [Nitrosopumilus sp.]|nr:ATP-binding protein [Nitrosopumilus sp.]